MSKRLFLAAITVVLVATALYFRPVRTVHAQSSSCSGSGSNEICDVNGKITWYATDWGNNEVMVSTNAPVENPGSCTNPGQYETPADSEVAASAALLSAFVNSKSVTLQIGTSCTGTAGRATINGVQVFP